MTDFYPRGTGRRSSTGVSAMELDHSQINNEVSFNAFPSNVVDNSMWMGQPHATFSRSGQDSMFPNSAHLTVQTGPYVPQNSHLSPQDEMTISPLTLQIPAMGQSSSFDSPFAQQDYLPIGQLDDGSDRECGLSEVPSDFIVYDYEDDFMDFAVPPFDAMGAFQQPGATTDLMSQSLIDYTDRQDAGVDMVPVPKMPKRTQKRLTEDQNMKLQNWFYLHFEHPYPNSDEVVELQQTTNLTEKQIRNWFARSRQRKISNAASPRDPQTIIGQALVRQSSLGSEKSHGNRKSSPTPGKDSLKSLSCHRGSVALQSKGSSVQSFQSQPRFGHPQPILPLETGGKLDIDWWLTHVDDIQVSQHNTNPRTRAPTITVSDTSQMDFARINMDAHVNPDPNFTTSPTGLVPDIPDGVSEHAMSVPSRRSSCKSNSSNKSHRSHHSSHSGSSAGVHGQRRGRRRVTNTTRSPSQASSIREYAGNGVTDMTRGTGGEKFYCHYCTETFGRKYTLKRHLDTIHGQEQRPWMCNMRDVGPPGMPQCDYCLLLGPFQECMHKAQACETKSERERSFWRKDHLKQHLEGVHKLSKELINTIDLDQWRPSEPLLPSPAANVAFAFDNEPPPKPLSRVGTGELLHKAFSSMSHSVTKRFKIGHSSSSRRT